MKLRNDVKAQLKLACEKLGVRTGTAGGSPGDAKQYSPLMRCYRAADVVLRGGKPTNLHRNLPGGATIGEVLAAARIFA